MINADERYLLQQAKFTEREINTQMQKFYNLFRISPMPIMNKEWVGLTDEEYEAMAEDHVTDCYFDTLEYAKAIEAKLKEKNT